MGVKHWPPPWLAGKSEVRETNLFHVRAGNALICVELEVASAGSLTWVRKLEATHSDLSAQICEYMGGFV